MAQEAELKPDGRVRLFGEMQFFRGQEAEPVDVHFKTQKARLLFAYLLLNIGKTVNREVLAAQFWPDSDAVAGRHNLRDALSFIRQALAKAGISDAGIDARHSTVRLSPEAFVTDVALFDSTLSRANRPGSAIEMRFVDYKQAVGLYRGPFLDGYFDIDELEEWIAPTRRRYTTRFDELLSLLTMLHTTHGNLRQALIYARRSAENDPDNSARATLVQELTEQVRRQDEQTLAAQRLPEAVTPDVPAPKEVVPVPQNPRKRRHALIGSLAWATVLLTLGLPLIQLYSQYERAKVSTTAAIKEGDPGDLKEINSFLAPAAQAMEVEDYKRAYGHYCVALVEAKSPKQRLVIANKLSELGKSAHMRDKGKGSIALIAFEKALEIYRREKVPCQMADTLLMIANAATIRGDRPYAMACLTEASQLAQTLSDELKRAALMERVGQCSLDIGDYVAARANLEAALLIFQKGTSPDYLHGVAFTLWGLGQHASDTGKYDQAKHYMIESAKRMAELKNEKQTRAAVLGSLGDVYLRQKDLDAASALYKEGLGEWEKINHSYWTAFFKARLARVALCRAEEWAANEKTRPFEKSEGQALVREAEKQARESLVLLKESNGPTGKALPLCILGKALLYQGRHEEASKSLTESVTFRRQVGNPCTLAESLEALAYFESQMKKPDAAKRHAEEAASLREKAGTPLPPCYRSDVVAMREGVGLPPL